MEEKNKNDKGKDYERINISKELIQIFNREREKINHFAWDELKTKRDLNDVKISRIVAKKYKEAKLDI